MSKHKGHFNGCVKGYKYSFQHN